MSQGFTLPLRPDVQGLSRVLEATTVRWYAWCCLAAVTCSSVGVIWDISWHKSIGRDSFWTPAHVLIYLSGILAGIACGYLIISTTYNKESPLRPSSVKLWGFRGPLGAFMCAWGGIAMLTSAPFDDWWHNAYGLDVKVLSPPHMLLTLGLIGIRIGALTLILSQMNRTIGELAETLHWMLLYLFVFLAAITVGAVQEFTIRNYMHSGQFYLLVSIAAPIWLAAVSVVSSKRWACTIVAAMYTSLFLLFIWILPLFPAEPKLGPVFFQVKQMIPPDFPLLLIAPAFAIDLLRPVIRNWDKPLKAAAMGALFLASFVAAQWPFAYFLMSPLARNAVFGTHYIPYFVNPETDYARYVFTALETSGLQFSLRIAAAVIAAIATSYAGLSWGAWMKRLRR
ncbi:MAG: hypothetical protein EXQ52_08100 [Bryobacterales bacterium]|nr:hypothetical protein [Bryobacterales bacterium]